MHRIITRALALSVMLMVIGCAIGDNGLMNEGNAVVEKVEVFLRDNGRLPASLTEIGEQERLEGPLYYDILDSTAFIVWFDSATGESVLYDSRAGQWRKF